jgi:hypothetical protein
MCGTEDVQYTSLSCIEIRNWSVQLLRKMAECEKGGSHFEILSCSDTSNSSVLDLGWYMEFSVSSLIRKNVAYVSIVYVVSGQGGSILSTRVYSESLYQASKLR